MSSEVDILIPIKDSPDWELFNDMFTVWPKMSIHRCDYRYDHEKQLIYLEEIKHRACYTYIAKARGYDIYKIGRTTCLKRRAKELQSVYPYSLLNLQPIAFCDRDIENSIKTWSMSIFRKLPEPFERCSELLLFSEKDIDKVISELGFYKIDGELPGEIAVVKRTYYHPETGEFMGSSTKHFDL